MTEKEEILKRILKTYRENEGNIITILQDLEDTFGYIPEEAVNWISKKLEIPASRFFGVATFYAQFRFTRPGEHLVKVCCGTACHVRGGERILNAVERELGITPGETTEDYKFSLERVACMGCCALAPVIVVDKTVYSKLKLTKVREALQRYGEEKKDIG